MDEIINRINQLKAKVKLLGDRLNIEGKREQVMALEAKTFLPDFWTNPLEAQKTTKLLALFQDQIAEIKFFEEKLSALEEVALSLEAEVLFADLTEELVGLEKLLAKLEINVYLSGPYDASAAILSIHAGQGGTEAMDWAAMLRRMYLRFAESRDWRVDVVDEIAGEEAGIKSTTMVIDGPFAYGYLKWEAGTHRLVRQSPFNADKLRQTSFALVEVLPEIKEADKLAIPESELEWDFFRASSHGGQNVQKVSTAVRLRHLPSGIVVSSQSERYQERNREIALNLLRAKLWQIEEEKREKEKKALKGEFKLASWGNQIRSYVLHPYKMAKDLRTGLETGDPFAVLDGELDDFIEAELRNLS